jgi:hypothetical protein
MVPASGYGFRSDEFESPVGIRNTRRQAKRQETNRSRDSSALQLPRSFRQHAQPREDAEEVLIQPRRSIATIARGRCATSRVLPTMWSSASASRSRSQVEHLICDQWVGGSIRAAGTTQSASLALCGESGW